MTTREEHPIYFVLPVTSFLPRDATPSAVMPQHVLRPSVRLSVTLSGIVITRVGILRK